MSSTTEETWMPEARQVAAQCWCDKETEGREMDVVLAEAVARRIAAWMDTAAQSQRNTDYYRGLLVQCGKFIGEPAFTCDDGSKSEDVLCAKIPELVEDLTTRHSLLDRIGADLGRALEQALETMENFPVESSHAGPCSPPATPCDGECQNAYYYAEQLQGIREVLREWREGKRV